MPATFLSASKYSFINCLVIASHFVYINYEYAEAENDV